MRCNNDNNLDLHLKTENEVPGTCNYVPYISYHILKIQDYM